MVAVAAFAMVATLPGRTHGLGMVTERVLADPRIGLDRLAYGHLNLWATLIGAIFCLGIGRLTDGLGSRLVLAVTLALLAVAVLGMSLAGGTVAFFVAVTLTRGLGQSALSVVSITLVGKWFRRRLGWAMGVYAVLIALGFMATYQAGQAFAETDWRLFWAGIGGALLISVPIAWLLTRDTPESCGLAVDGDAHDEEAPIGSSMTLAEALRTPAFWVFALSTSVFGLVAAGVALFNESILADLGFERTAYFEMLSLGVPFGLAAKFGTGWLASRVPLGTLTAAALLLLGLTLAGLTGLRSYADLVTYTATSAIAGSAITVVFFTVWGRLYGRTQLGRIQAAAQMLTVLASAVGPLAFAMTKEATGSYAPALWTSAAVLAMLAVAAWVIPLPKPHLLDSERLPPPALLSHSSRNH
ncbi:MAG: MFS transporter [Planctomycetaceae bacterium]|nr:MFS transporter [Planctomycetaceae bacterium]